MIKRADLSSAIDNVVLSLFPESKIKGRRREREDDGAGRKRSRVSRDGEEFSVDYDPHLFYQNRLHFLEGEAQRINARTIGLEDLITENCKRAIVTTYLAEIEYAVACCPVLKSIPFQIIHDHEGLKSVSSCKYLALSRARGLLPYGCGHGKIFLLFYDAFLRVVVTTANLSQGDWEAKIQGTWFQDFLVAKDQQKSLKDSDFYMTLCDYFERIANVQRCVFDGYDFSTAAVSLITTVPGVFRGNSMHQYGHLKVRRLLKNEDPPGEDSRVICHCSSIGALSQNWMDDFATSLVLRAKKVPLIVWPTVEMVRTSVDGYAAGGSLCFPKRNLKSIVQDSLVLWDCVRPGCARVTPHIKLYGRFRAVSSKGKGKNDVELMWVLLTSANLSKSAWGEQQRGNSQLMMRSYEAGVLFRPVNLETFVVGTIPGRFVTANGVRFTFPFPSSFPPRPYTSQDSPWIWDVPYSVPDVFSTRWNP